MIRTLAIDTTAHFGSIALLEDEGIREEILLHAPEGFGGIIRDRSSVASKMGCFVKAGIIDNGYRGEIFVLIFNSTTLPVTVKKGAKIAQMILTPVYTVEVVEVEELDETSRGTGGFGSTGA